MCCSHCLFKDFFPHKPGSCWRNDKSLLFQLAFYIVLHRWIARNHVPVSTFCFISHTVWLSHWHVALFRESCGGESMLLSIYSWDFWVLSCLGSSHYEKQTYQCWQNMTLTVAKWHSFHFGGHSGPEGGNLFELERLKHTFYHYKYCSWKQSGTNIDPLMHAKQKKHKHSGLVNGPNLLTDRIVQW